MIEWNIETIIMLVLLAIIITTSIIIATCKDAKTKGAQDAYKRAKTLQAIILDLPNIMVDSEKLLKGTGITKCGSTKKDIVLNSVQLRCLNAGVDYDNEMFSEQVEKILKAPQGTKYKEKDYNNGTV